MKRILVIALLVFTAALMHADTINLIPSAGGWTYAFVTTTPGVYGETLQTVICCGAYSQLQAYSGITKGNITTFYAGSLQMDSNNVFNVYNGTFNSKTDIFKGTIFMNQKLWYLTEVLNPTPVAIYSYGYSSTVTSAKLRTSTVPEPSTLGLLGTGLFMIAGIARKRLVGQQSYSI
jgi:hypothetical protein